MHYKLCGFTALLHKFVINFTSIKPFRSNVVLTLQHSLTRGDWVNLMECVNQQNMSVPVSSLNRETNMQNTVFADMDERRLLERIANNQDVDALEQLYTTHKKILFFTKSF